MKLLSVFRTEEGIIIERRNQLVTESKDIFHEKYDMLEHLDVLEKSGQLDGYKLNVSNEFWQSVIKCLTSIDKA